MNYPIHFLRILLKTSLVIYQERTYEYTKTCLYIIYKTDIMI